MAAATSGQPRVAAVVVTYNRRDLLLESLAAVHGQTRPPDAVIVVDNASADDTAAAVRKNYPAVQLAELARNTGGAGGFAYGMALALAGGADLIWLLDDDTVPEPGALAALLDASGHRAAEPPVLVASRVVWTDGRAHPMNTPRPKPFMSTAERQAAAAAGCLPIRSASFVSILVDAEACRRRGLPQAGYFLWNDDFEFTTRLAVPGQRGCAQDRDVRLDRHRPRAPLLLRGAEQDLDAAGQRPAGTLGTAAVRGRNCPPLGTNLRPVTGPGHAGPRVRPGGGRRGAVRPASHR